MVGDQYIMPWAGAARFSAPAGRSASWEGACRTSIEKRRSSIQRKLLFGFAILTSFGVLATSVAFISSRFLANKFYQIESESLKPLMELISISRQTATISTILTNIARAETGTNLEKAMRAVVNFRASAITNLAAIPSKEESVAELKSLKSSIEDLSFSAVLLCSVTAERMSLRSERESLTASVRKTHQKIYQTLVPMIDGANFNIRKGFQDYSTDSRKESDNSLRELNETLLSILLTLTELRSETNLITGILAEASLVTERVQLVSLRDKLTASAYRVRTALKELSNHPEFKEVAHPMEALLLLAGNNSIIDVRDKELLASEKTSRLIQDSREKQERLQIAVEMAAEHSRETVSHLILASNKEIFAGNSLLAALSLASVAGFAGAYLFIHRHITRRLTKLRHAIITVANGNLATTVPIDGNDELTDMGAAVDTFKANAVKLKELEEERTRNFERATQALKSKNEFLANMSHELRTPMHAILSYAKIGLDSIHNAEISELEVYFNNIGKAGGRLLGLLNNLLDLAKLEAGKMPFNKSLDDFSVVLEQALLELAPILHEKSLNVMTNISATDTKLIFDKQRMTQVIINLLANSAKFSPKGSSIDLSVSDGMLPNGAKALCCAVADNGISIPESELETVFDKFVQSSKSKTGAGGTGLGLAICREIVEAHGGKIWAENRAPKGVLLSFLIAKNVNQQAS